MNFDVSEIKTKRGCDRQWQLTSRNRMHLTLKELPKQLTFGTLFHEALHSLYLGTPLDKVMEMVKKEMSVTDDAALLAMVPGYAKNVIPEDLDRYRVLDIEHKFCIPLLDLDDVNIVGSIDMIAADDAEHKIYGFEHKTCKNFRDQTYLWMDEQPRMYYIALERYTDEYNKKMYNAWCEECAEIDAYPPECRPDVYPEEPVVYTVGAVYLNEVKKLVRDFQYNRTPCVYTASDLKYFLKAFVQDITRCKHDMEVDAYAAPKPDFMKCQMCMFKEICQTYMYSDISKDQILADFSSTIKERETDHLEEKAERSGS